MPVELDELTRKIMSLEIERQALKKEKDEISKKRIDEIDENLVTMEEKETDLRSKWESEKEAKTEINKKNNDAEDEVTRGEIDGANKIHEARAEINKGTSCV